MEGWADDKVSGVVKGHKPPAATQASAPTPVPALVPVTDDNPIADDMEGWAADRAKPALEVNAPPSGTLSSALPPPPPPLPAAPHKVGPPSAAPPAAGPSEELASLAARLRDLPADGDAAAICEVLLALERQPVTVDDLKQTQLGVLTQRFKDCPDKQVCAVVKRLRHAWKEALRNTR